MPPEHEVWTPSSSHPLLVRIDVLPACPGPGSGDNISPWNAKVEPLFEKLPHTIAIGDGGNEARSQVRNQASLSNCTFPSGPTSQVGFGKVSHLFPSVAPGSLLTNPSVTPCDRLVCACTSNGGCLGLLAALSASLGEMLLPVDKFELVHLVEKVPILLPSVVRNNELPVLPFFPPLIVYLLDV